MTINHFDTLVIGGGQAGLAAGYHLSRRAADFLIVDANPTIGAVWHNRWDSLRLFTPAQYDGLPGMAFPAAHDIYPGKDAVADYLRSYADRFALPIRLSTPVTRLSHDGQLFHAAIPDGTISARSVIVATGPFQIPSVPTLAADLATEVVQLHSADYRNPVDLPHGPTLVVGGGNSGFQIAEELAATRDVVMSIGKRVPALPQRPLGRDIFWWLDRIGFSRITMGSRLGRRLSTKDALIGVSRRRLQRAGAVIRPRLIAADGPDVVFSDDTRFVPSVVVWSTGYRRDYSWIDVSGALDGGALPIHRRGISSTPGLGYVGLPWQHTRGSALLGGVGRDVEYVVARINDLSVSGPIHATQSQISDTPRDASDHQSRQGANQ